jgi:hypothetical protein
MATSCERTGTATMRQGPAPTLRRYAAPGGFRSGHHRECQQYRLSAGDLALLYARATSRGGARRQTGKELPAVIGNRQALLNLPLDAYKQYEKQVEHGFVQAAKFSTCCTSIGSSTCPISRRSCPGSDHRGHGRGLGARGQPGQARTLVLERRVRGTVRFSGGITHRSRLHGSATRGCRAGQSLPP